MTEFNRKKPIQRCLQSTYLMAGLVFVGTVISGGLISQPVAAVGAPGTVVANVVYTPAAIIKAQAASSRRIRYVSTAKAGQTVEVSGLVFTPKKRTAHNKIVAWAHGTTGLADKCAPSLNQEMFYDEAAKAVAGYLAKGWTVTATDYVGLGTSGEHPYLVGESEGRAVIDSVRAARKLDTGLSTQWAVTGHSQGGQAALFAGQLAKTYGQGLDLKAVVAMAPASNLDLLAQSIPGTPAQGYIALSLYGLAASDSSVKPGDYLAKPARDQVPKLWQICGDGIIDPFANLTAKQMLKGDGSVPAAIVQKMARSNPGQVRSAAPVLLVQGTKDQTIPLPLTQNLMAQVCAAGTTAELVTYNQSHVGVVNAARTKTEGYINNRFNGQAAQNRCQG